MPVTDHTVPDCPCYRCTKDRFEAAQYPEPERSVRTIQTFGHMFLCSVCGNKRCPHAANHRLACTHSNEPGQKGSLYEGSPKSYPGNR